MHGCGNDYIYVNTMEYAVPNPQEASIVWSDRHKGIGSDGLVLIGASPVPEADFTMHIYNADVDMLEPVLENEEQFIAARAQGRGTFVSMGNPHYVIFTDNVDQVGETGRALEHHLAFPQRCNIEFARVENDGSIRTRVWERGSGITPPPSPAAPEGRAVS